MPSSYDRIVLHSVWSTKHRQDFIDLNIEPELYTIMGSQFKKAGCKVIKIGGTDNHVHCLHTLPRTKCIADVIRAVKATSSGWLRDQGEQYLMFAWQTGYATFSASYKKLDNLIYYVGNQRLIHAERELSFETEYIAYLEAYDLPYDPKYVWD